MSSHGVAAPHPSDRGRPRALGQLRQPDQAARRPRPSPHGDRPGDLPLCRPRGRHRWPPGASAAGPLAPLAIGTHPGGVDSASWHRFRTGKLPAARTLDLHGRTAQRAFHALAAFLRDGARGGAALRRGGDRAGRRVAARTAAVAEPAGASRAWCWPPRIRTPPTLARCGCCCGGRDERRRFTTETQRTPR